jgi:hypothetical protein
MTGCQETPYATVPELHPARRYPGRAAAFRQRFPDRRTELPHASARRGVGRMRIREALIDAGLLGKNARDAA